MNEGAKVIGLSALMTTTMMRMKDVVELAKEKGCTAKIVIGGAAITESFRMRSEQMAIRKMQRNV